MMNLMLSVCALLKSVCFLAHLEPAPALEPLLESNQREMMAESLFELGVKPIVGALHAQDSPSLQANPEKKDSKKLNLIKVANQAQGPREKLPEIDEVCESSQPTEPQIRLNRRIDFELPAFTMMRDRDYQLFLINSENYSLKDRFYIHIEDEIKKSIVLELHVAPSAHEKNGIQLILYSYLLEDLPLSSGSIRFYVYQEHLASFSKTLLAYLGP